MNAPLDTLLPLAASAFGPVQIVLLIAMIVLIVVWVILRKKQ